MSPKQMTKRPVRSAKSKPRRKPVSPRRKGVSIARRARSTNVVSVGEIMTVRPVVVREDASVGEAWNLLRALDIRHLPVINADRELVGIVSDRDFTAPPMSAALAELVGNQAASLTAPVSSIMTGAPLSVEQDDDVREAMELMVENKVGALPVVGPEGHVVGIVSYLDVLRAALG